jgi:hypothetical protein
MIRIAFLRPDLSLARVSVRPSPLERLVLRAVDRDETLVAVPDPAGGRLWLHDHTGERCRSASVITAIERARRAAEQQPGAPPPG